MIKMETLKNEIIGILKEKEFVSGSDVVKALNGDYFKSPAYVYGYLSALADLGVIKKIVKSRTVVFYRL